MPSLKKTTTCALTTFSQHVFFKKATTMRRNQAQPTPPTLDMRCFMLWSRLPPGSSSPRSELTRHRVRICLSTATPNFFESKIKVWKGFLVFFLKCTGCTEKKTYANMSIYNVSYWFLCVEYMILQAASHFGVGEGIAKKLVHETILKHLGGSITVGAGLISMSFGYDFFDGILWLNNNWLAVRHKMTFPFPAKDSSPGWTKIPQVGELPHVESGL